MTNGVKSAYAEHDTINERTSGTGVTVDGVVLKDSKVTGDLKLRNISVESPIKVDNDGDIVTLTASQYRTLIGLATVAASGSYADLSNKPTSFWSDVAVPTGFDWTPPFTIQSKDGAYRIRPDFDIRSRAGITVVATYYVDRRVGNDSNAGTSWSAPLATLAAAASKPDVDRIFIRGGRYWRSECIPAPSRNVEVIAADDDTIISSSFNNRLSTWTPTGNYYQASVTGSDYAAGMLDYSNLDELGNPQRLERKTSIAEVDAQAGSFWQQTSGTDVYVRLFDDRAPDSQVFVIESLSLAAQGDALTVYYENVTFEGGGIRVRNNTAAGGARAYFNDCVFPSAAMYGVDEVIFESCIAGGVQGDIANYDARNGVATRVAEIDCKFGGGDFDTMTQASTNHNGGRTIGVLSQYFSTSGQNVANAVNSHTWLVACAAYRSESGVGFYTDSKMWLEGCRSYHNATDLQNTSGATTYTKDFDGMSSNDIGGTLTAY